MKYTQMLGIIKLAAANEQKNQRTAAGIAKPIVSAAKNTVAKITEIEPGDVQNAQVHDYLYGSGKIPASILHDRDRLLGLVPALQDKANYDETKVPLTKGSIGLGIGVGSAIGGMFGNVYWPAGITALGNGIYGLYNGIKGLMYSRTNENNNKVVRKQLGLDKHDLFWDGNGTLKRSIPRKWLNDTDN